MQRVDHVASKRGLEGEEDWLSRRKSSQPFGSELGSETGTGRCRVSILRSASFVVGALVHAHAGCVLSHRLIPPAKPYKPWCLGRQRGRGDLGVCRFKALPTPLHMTVRPHSPFLMATDRRDFTN